MYYPPRRPPLPFPFPPPPRSPAILFVVWLFWSFVKCEMALNLGLQLRILVCLID